MQQITASRQKQARILQPAERIGQWAATAWFKGFNFVGRHAGFRFDNT
jgi:hypothetical protein